ncbi:Peroxisomal sarcosine oxidase [Oopsacas minuta]|uniref:Peroxisomal sarcosine oxidase n=1 Tax=Oopsacas minuta TaxID=111878 RepID=A0AAV7KAA4_9METZ|nr:Peroxisomal sarcosine oxidase [Oopsacas minuta]
MQEYEYPGYLKVALRGSIACDPDKRDSVDIDSITVPKLAQFITNTFPYGMLDTSSPGITEQCIYTMTPDSNSIIDQHPIHSNIYICCGFSGHGFKLAPVIGQLMSDMLYGTETKFDLKHFSLKRFKKAKL